MLSREIEQSPQGSTQKDGLRYERRRKWSEWYKYEHVQRGCKMCRKRRKINCFSSSYVIFHLSAAACTSLPISAFACFFALVVMPSSTSIAPGDVWRGSNSKTWPSFVGIDTSAESDCSIVGLDVWCAPCSECAVGYRAVGYNKVFCVESWDCDVVVACGAVWESEWEFVRQWPLKVEGNATDGSLRIMMLFFDCLFDAFSFVEILGWEDCKILGSSASASASACSMLLNQPMPNWYGFASGDPFILSILSSFLGRRIVDGRSLLPLIPDGVLLFGNFMFLSGREGLKFELEGTRPSSRCDWAIDLLGLCFMGDAGCDVDWGLDEVYMLKGGLDFVGLGDGSIRETVFD